MSQKIVFANLEKTAEVEARDEITDYTTYIRLSKIGNNPKVKQLFSEISKMELKHYQFWIEYTTRQKICPRQLKIHFVLFLRWVLGASIAIKYLEGQEASTIKKYQQLETLVPPEDKESFEKIMVDEKGH